VLEAEPAKEGDKPRMSPASFIAPKRGVGSSDAKHEIGNGASHEEARMRSRPFLLAKLPAVQFAQRAAAAGEKAPKSLRNKTADQGNTRSEWSEF
jgi:hypothetical protein